MQFDIEAKEMGEKHWLPKASNGSLETSNSSTPKNGELGLYMFVKILGSTSTLAKWAKSTNSIVVSICRIHHQTTRYHHLQTYKEKVRMVQHG